VATIYDRDEMDRVEQMARTSKNVDEMVKTQADTLKAYAETRKIEVETALLPRSTIFQAMITTAALLGAGAAIAKFFFP